ncbi:MAG TPA: glycosyltransferase [Actinomycetota bacterium]|jgi:trehalose synthase
MPKVTSVDIAPLDPRRFEEVLTPDQFSAFAAAIDAAKTMFEGRVVWNVNSTARGGGVAEMLRSLIARARGAGVDARWVVIEGEPEFFRITKRIHNNLHGAAGDGGDLGDAERALYEAALKDNLPELLHLVSPDDVVILHDPQTAGLVGQVAPTGATVVWRCHVGIDLPDDLSRRAWRWLIPYVTDADAFVFSRQDFAWEGLPENKIEVIPPSIDAFSPKNQDIDESSVRAILAATGLATGDTSHATYERTDGSEGRVERTSDLFGTDAPPDDAKLVVQVSRWDALKDPIGVIEGFADHAAEMEGVHLVIAGPAVDAVSDDPEGAEMLQRSLDAWKGLSPSARASIHLATLPMDDGDENAAIVNALQRRADIVVQKSLAEGFGLTVAEAMWKGRPVVASRIGGIQDQIVDGETGVLIDDPRDKDEFGRALARLLKDPEDAARMGRDAQRRVRDHFLGPQHLMRYVDLLGRLLASG